MEETGSLGGRCPAARRPLSRARVHPEPGACDPASVPERCGWSVVLYERRLGVFVCTGCCVNGPGQSESVSTLGGHVAQRFEKSVETRMCKPTELGSNVPEF